ncbi:MAG: hypothetical protein EOP09_12830 [Proteobacteria bacterium]|nr:MAG: hypothetical protein EOP09_12830 [Pseudomonadota bacterium]
MKQALTWCLLSAGTTHSAFAAVPHSPMKAIESDLAQFSAKKEIRFDQLAHQWESKYGTDAVPSLVAIAKDPKKKDSERFVALLSIARLNPKNASAITRPFFKDSSWMLRSAAIQSTVLRKDRTAAPDIISLLKDPALVIRAEAATAIGDLKLETGEKPLLDALYEAKNYRPAGYQKGQADWVTGRALESLRKLGNKESAQQLLTLMNGAKDPKVRAQALYTIERLEGKKLVKSEKFKDRALAWNQHYSTRTFTSQAAAKRAPARGDAAASSKHLPIEKK